MFKRFFVLTLILILANSYGVKARCLYSTDGRTINVHENEVEAYVNVGWYEYPVVTMYTSDGRSLVVRQCDVKIWENVGWFDGRKIIKIYAPDGRSAIIPLWQLQSYLNVGWYDYPVDNTGRTSDISYYSGTTIKKYDSVSDGILIYSDYNQTQDAYMCVYHTTLENKNSYILYLRNDGWDCVALEGDDNVIRYAFVKGHYFLTVGYYYKSGEIYLTYNK